MDCRVEPGNDPMCLFDHEMTSAMTSSTGAVPDARADALLASFERAGFALADVELGEIEKAGGSLRCCVAEIF